MTIMYLLSHFFHFERTLIGILARDFVYPYVRFAFLFITLTLQYRIKLLVLVTVTSFVN